MNALTLLLLAAQPWMQLDNATRAAEVTRLRGSSLRERVVQVSERFLTTPYVLSPLGEGEGVDADPLLRFDAVDCVTMVEESMALSLAPSDEQVLPWLNRIRYAGGVPSYAARNHVVESQWLPWLVEQAVLRDVTKDLAGAATKHVTKTITAETWAGTIGKSLGLPTERQSVGSFALDIVPVKDAAKLLADAPNGLVVIIVRADRPNNVTRVTHMGLLIQGPKGPMLRHASKSYHRVVDEPLTHYLTRNLEFGAWTVEGLSLFEIVEPPRADVTPPQPVTQP